MLDRVIEVWKTKVSPSLRPDCARRREFVALHEIEKKKKERKKEEKRTYDQASSIRASCLFYERI
jgi:hypothetical protein